MRRRARTTIFRFPPAFVGPSPGYCWHLWHEAWATLGNSLICVAGSAAALIVLPALAFWYWVRPFRR